MSYAHVKCRRINQLLGLGVFGGVEMKRPTIRAAGEIPRSHERDAGLQNPRHAVSMVQGPGSRRVSNGLTNIRRATKVFGTKLRGHVGFVGCFCS